MLIVYLLSHDGASESFQMPCRFAGNVPGRLLEISRYLPNLEVERFERQIDCARFHPSQSLVGWQLGRDRIQRQLRAPGEALIVRDVARPQFAHSSRAESPPSAPSARLAAGSRSLMVVAAAISTVTLFAPVTVTDAPSVCMRPPSRHDTRDSGKVNPRRWLFHVPS